MFGLIKAKKIATSVKILTASTDDALDNIMSSSESTDQLLNRLGITRQMAFEAITSDDEVESCREDLRTGLLAKQWRLYGENANDDDIDVLYRIVRKQFPILVELVLTAKINGYSIARMVYEYDENGFLTIKQISDKSGELEKHTPKNDGTVIYSGNGGTDALDTNVLYLFLVNRPTSTNPAGEMAGARLYPAVAIRKQGFIYAAQFIKRYAQPYIVGKIEGEEEIQNGFVTKLYQFLSGGAISIAREDQIEMLQNSAYGQAFQRLERMANARIQKILLGKVKTADLENGSRAAQETEEETKGDRLDGYAGMLTGLVQQVVDALLLVNQAYGKSITAPKGLWFKFQKEDEINIKRAERDTLYCEKAGLELTGDYFIDIVGLDRNHFKRKALLPDEPLSRLRQPIQSKLSDLMGSQNTVMNKLAESKLNAVLNVLNDAQDYHDFEQKLTALDSSEGDQEIIQRLISEGLTQVMQGQEQNNAA